MVEALTNDAAIAGGEPAASAPASAEQAQPEQNELERILRQHGEGLGTINIKELWGPDPVVEGVKRAVSLLRQRGLRGAMRAMFAGAVETEAPIRPEPPAPGLFRRYARYSRFLQAEQAELRLRLQEDDAYQYSMGHWNARIDHVDAEIAAVSSQGNQPSARLEALNRQKEEYLANRSAAQRRCGVLTAHELHELALENALNGTLSRLDQLRTDAHEGRVLWALKRSPATPQPSSQPLVRDSIEVHGDHDGDDASRSGVVMHPSDYETALLDGGRSTSVQPIDEDGVATTCLALYPFRSSDR